MNTIWCNYEVPDDLELPDLSTATDEELYRFVLDNDLECDWLYETSSDILNYNRKFIIGEISKPTFEVLNDDYNVIYDNGNTEL